MEPPGEGRYETRRQDHQRSQTAAAMEPPGEGRYENPVMDLQALIRRMPQWSRPVKGGTRVMVFPVTKSEEAAAMEPPGEGRYEPRANPGDEPHRRAAMEPPGEGRYETTRPAGGSAPPSGGV